MTNSWGIFGTGRQHQRASGVNQGKSDEVGRPNSNRKAKEARSLLRFADHDHKETAVPSIGNNTNRSRLGQHHLKCTSSEISKSRYLQQHALRGGACSTEIGWLGNTIIVHFSRDTPRTCHSVPLQPKSATGQLLNISWEHLNVDIGNGADFLTHNFQQYKAAVTQC
jgi:hypothetical protein